MNLSKVININSDVYPLDEVLKDLNNLKDNIDDLVIVTILKDGTAFVSHTGLNFLHMALACKLMDKEFSNLIDLNEDTTDEE